jgi:hypothetical protein
MRIKTAAFGLAFTLATITSPAVAQTAQSTSTVTHTKAKAATAQKASVNTISRVVINAQLVSSTVFDGKVYVTPEDVARALGASLSYSASGVALTTTPVPPQPVPTAPQPVLNGSIRGTLTFYFNDNYKDKPDSGTDIWLLSGNINISEDTYAHFARGDSYGIGGGQDGGNTVFYPIIRHTIADGAGSFAISDVPPGDYSLVMESKHASGSGHRDAYRKTYVAHLTISAGGTSDASHDFE